MRQIGDQVLAHLDDATDEIGQALAVLGAAGVERPEDLSLGTGDRLLLDILGQIAGRYPELTVGCPDCGELNSVVLAPDRLPPAVVASAWWGPGGGLRQPTYGDMQAIGALLAAGRDPDTAAAALLSRCTVGTPPRPASGEDLDRIDDALTGPITVACVGCGRLLEADVDVERITVEGLAGRAREVEFEIHLLARAYRWELATIEALPDRRRHRLATLVADGR